MKYYATCAVCGSSLEVSEVEVDMGEATIRIEPCDMCLNNAYNNGRHAGYNSGYDNGSRYGQSEMDRW